MVENKMLNICKQVLTVIGLYDSDSFEIHSQQKVKILGTIVKGTIKLKEKHKSFCRQTPTDFYE